MLGSADQRAFRVGDDGDQLAVANVVGEAVIPATDGVLGVALRARRERHAAVQAAILDGVDLAVDALEQDALAEHDLAAAFALGQLVAEECRVPVVAESELGLEVGPPRPPRCGFALAGEGCTSSCIGGAARSAISQVLDSAAPVNAQEIEHQPIELRRRARPGPSGRTW